MRITQLYLGMAMLMLLTNCSEKLVLSNPESICYQGSTKTHFISNNGNGHIIKCTKGKKNKFFSKANSGLLGIICTGGVVYVAENVKDGDDFIRGYDSKTAQEIMAVQIKGSKQLNDIATDNQGSLFVSDRVGNKIYKINVHTARYEIILNGQIQTPNGLYFKEKENTLLVCNTLPKSSIYEIDLTNNEVKLLIETEYPHFDGITLDESGTIYVSSWAEDWSSGKLLKFNGQKASVLLENKGVADISYNPQTKSIDITNFMENTVQSIKVDQM